MPLVTLLHNPTAGDEDHSGEHLTSMIHHAGYTCKYVSVKDSGWDKFDPKTTFIAVAGGDGTVRKTVKALLDNKEHYPIALLPSGTANNIAASLRIKPDHAKTAALWNSKKLRNVDMGTISGLPETHFFLESFGCGLLPALMTAMDEREDLDNASPNERLKTAIRVLHDLSLTYEPRHCELTVDGQNYSGEYLLVEIMNMPYAGPNLHLAPDADLSDNLFDVIIVTADGRRGFADFVTDAKVSPIKGTCRHLRGSTIKLKWHGDDVHADDEVVAAKDTEIQIGIKQKAIQFLA